MRRWRPPAWAPVVGVLVVVLALLYALGAARPLAPHRIAGDRLGPEPGQAVAVYVAEAAESLRVLPNGDERWALVSPEAEWTTAQTWQRLGEPVGGRARIGRLLMRVPLPRIQTPTVTVAPGQSAAGVGAADTLGADRLPELVAPGERGAAIARVAAARMRAHTGSVVGAVVLGTGADLRTIARQPGVRAVQALPDDAGRFGLSPLLPEYTERAVPGPDDGPVPTS